MELGAMLQVQKQTEVMDQVKSLAVAKAKVSKALTVCATTALYSDH
jgi:hypothetical protein